MQSPNISHHTTTPDTAEAYDPAECQSSEATWLPVTWQITQSWPLSLRVKPMRAATRREKAESRA